MLQVLLRGSVADVLTIGGTFRKICGWFKEHAVLLKVRKHQLQQEQHKDTLPSKHATSSRSEYTVNQRWQKVLVPLALVVLSPLLFLSLHEQSVQLVHRWGGPVDPTPTYAPRLSTCSSGSGKTCSLVKESSPDRPIGGSVHSALTLILHHSLNLPVLERMLKSQCFDAAEQELLNTSYLPSAIPKIIHQTAKSNTSLPPLWAHNQQTWTSNHPTWKYNLWLDADNMQLVEEHFQWFARTYKSFKNPIMRVDAARYMYMYVHGGVYVDMDVESLKPLDPLLQGHQAVLAAMGKDLSFSDCFPNAFLASVPRHPFWLHVLLDIQERTSSWVTGKGNWLKVEETTGPAMLKRVLDREYPQLGCMYRANNAHSIFILEPQYIFPFDWHDPKPPARASCLMASQKPSSTTFDPKECKKHFPDSYAVSYWSHSWVPNLNTW